jgi:hypothetical protein
VVNPLSNAVLACITRQEAVCCAGVMQDAYDACCSTWDAFVLGVQSDSGTTAEPTGGDAAVLWVSTHMRAKEA